MEATDNYWMPIYNLQEGHFELIVVNAAIAEVIVAEAGTEINRFRTSITLPLGSACVRAKMKAPASAKAARPVKAIVPCEPP